MDALITGIKRFAVHDGDGIRTTVFFKGCSLKCVWCHNPETISALPQIGFYAHKCVGCGECVRVCESHSIVDGKHIFDRDNCNACAKCVKFCPEGALELFGERKSIEEICNLLLEDKQFYESSNGGITLSGGECLLQPEACAEILQQMKSAGIHTAVDTCGMVPKAAIDTVLPYTDIFLYDIKAIDQEVHIRCTGQSNKIILDNLVYITEMGKSVEIRYPFVPGFNDNQAEKIANFLKGLNNITSVRVLPYHNLAGSKYDSILMYNTLPAKIPTDNEIQTAKDEFLNIKSLCQDL